MTQALCHTMDSISYVLWRPMFSFLLPIPLKVNMQVLSSLLTQALFSTDILKKMRLKLTNLD